LHQPAIAEGDPNYGHEAEDDDESARSLVARRVAQHEVGITFSDV